MVAAIIIATVVWIGMNNDESIAVQAPDNQVVSCQTVPDPPVIYGVVPTGTQADYDAWKEKYGDKYRECTELHYHD